MIAILPTTQPFCLRLRAQEEGEKDPPAIQDSAEKARGPASSWEGKILGTQLVILNLGLAGDGDQGST